MLGVNLERLTLFYSETDVTLNSFYPSFLFYSEETETQRGTMAGQGHVAVLLIHGKALLPAMEHESAPSFLL